MISYFKQLVLNTVRYFNYEVCRTFQDNKLTVYRTGFSIASLLWIWELSKHQLTLKPILKDVESFIWFHGYWFFLGVLSSIGLGTGLHTGVLFLMPFITQITNFIYQHYTFDFVLYGENAFQLHNNSYLGITSDTCPVDFDMSSTLALQLFWKFYGVVFWWSFGAAVGEIPPYLFSRACLAELDIVNNPKIKKMMDWMIVYLEKYGFWMILGFASYPNMLFDMCGICCGIMGMRFLDFFIPVFIGKAIIKAGVQTGIWVALSYPGNLERFDLFAQTNFPPVVYNFLEIYLYPEQGLRQNDEISWTGYLWKAFVIFLCLKFCYSLLQYFSQKWESISREKLVIKH